MTDKTIIHGVDVRGCEYYGLTVHKKVAICYGNCKASITKYTNCKNNPNCYFKQSARKDERIRELEEKLETKTALLKDAKKAIERLTIKLQRPLKTKTSDPTEPLYRKLSQIAELAQKLRTKTDYHGEDEVNADLDQILQLINPRGNDRNENGRKYY